MGLWEVAKELSDETQDLALRDFYCEGSKRGIQVLNYLVWILRTWVGDLFA